MFRGGGEAGGGKKGKKSLEYVKPTPKFLSKMREQIVKQENDQIQSKVSTFKKKTMGSDIDYDLENATIVNSNEKYSISLNKKPENEIDLNDLQKNFKPIFVSKNQKLQNIENSLTKASKEENNKLEQPKEKSTEILGKRKALEDYIEDYAKEEQAKPEKKPVIINKNVHKKIKHNLLSFDH